jgi:thioredoxin 1
MVRFLGVALLTIGSLLVECVQEPVAVDDNDIHTPQSAIVVTQDNFDTLFSRGGVGVVEFYSAHCPVCTSMVWVIDSLAGVFGDSMLIGASNTETDTLWKRFAVQSVPTYLFFKNGVEVTRRSFTGNAPAVYDTVAAHMRTLRASSIIHDTIPANYLTLDTTSFDTTVRRTGRVAMVFFFNPDDARCIHMDSVVKEIAPRYINTAVIAKVLYTGEMSGLAMKFGIDSVPGFLFIKDSLIVEDCHGIIAGDTLRAVLDRLLAPTLEPVALDTSNFNALINIPGSIAMVDFYSPLCGSCQGMIPVVARLAYRFDGRALVAKVNIDEQDSLKTRFTIEWWPTFVFFKGGTEYQRVIGTVPEDSLAAVIERGIKGDI